MKNIISNNIYMLRYMWKYCKSNVILRLLSTLTAPVQPFIFIITMKLVLDGIATKENVNYLIYIILFSFIISVISSIFNSWVEQNSTEKAKKSICKGIQNELLKKSMTLDLSCYDDAEYYDRYTRAMREAEIRAIEVFNTVISIISSTIALVMIVLFIAQLSPLVILLCVAILLINLFLNSIRNKVVFKRDMEQTKIIRKASYSKSIFYDPQYAQEIRMGKLGDLMIKKFNIAMDESLKVVGKYCNMFVILESSFRIVGFLLMTLIMIYATWEISSGKLSIGDFAALLNGSQQLLEGLFALFGQLPAMSQNSMYVDNLRSVLDYKSEIHTTKEDSLTSNIQSNFIELKDVSFKYPKNNFPVLKNINMNIEEGKKTAIVGYNGAGKTTIVKLLLRFYDPTEGEIKIGECNYKKINVNSLRLKFGTVFQNYKCYALSIAENVCLENDISKQTEYKIVNSLKYSGLYDKISKFKNGIYTSASREFDTDGIPLSGGEQQKIAISRALVGNKEILIFDEPSSSLDPMAEYDINNKILEISKDKTVIFISHRLSTVRMADKIYMVDNGQIIEEGTHDELIKLGGKYQEMFDIQSKQYIESSVESV